jgi:putative flippase GtrA
MPNATATTPAAAAPPAPRRQRLPERLFWFLVGGLLSPSLDAGLTWLIIRGLHQAPHRAYPWAVLLTALCYFGWNYFVNFRTASQWHHCAGRYAIAFGVCWACTSLVGGVGIQHLSHGGRWSLVWLIATGTKLLTGPLKFALYHYWVFPPRQAQPQAG